MSEKLLLLRYDSNYADEFDVDGFAVWPESKWEEHKEAVSKFFDSRAKKRGEKPTLPDRSDPKYWEVYDQMRKWERGEEVERYFGTNESVSYSSLEDYLRCFKVPEITEEEHQTLKRLFGGSWRHDDIRFGMFLSLEDHLEDDSEEDEEDED